MTFALIVVGNVIYLLYMVYWIIEYISIFLCACCTMCIILFLYQKQQENNTPNMEYGIFKYDGLCVEHSKSFFQDIAITKERFWQDFQLTYPKQYNDLFDAIKSKNNAIIQLQDISLILKTNQNDYVMYLIFKAINYLDPEEQQFDHLQEVNLNLSGYFVTDGKYIYRKEIETRNHKKYTQFHKCCLLEEMQNMVLKIRHSAMLKSIPISFLVCTRDGKIIMYSNKFVDMFQINNEIKDISDFLHNIRGKIISDSANFGSVNDSLYNLIQTLSSDFSKKFNTLDNRTIEVYYHSVNNLIYMVYRDISDIFDYSYVESIFSELEQFIFTKINDIVVKIHENKVVFSNNKMIKTGITKEQAISYCKNLGISLQSANCKNNKFLIGNLNQVKVMGEIFDNITNKMNKIEKINVLISYKNPDYVSYLYLIRFLKLQIGNLLDFTRLYNSKQERSEEIIEFSSYFAQKTSEIQTDLHINNWNIKNNIKHKVLIKQDRDIFDFAIKQILIEILNCTTNKCDLDIENNFITFNIKTSIDQKMFALLNIPFHYDNINGSKIYFPIDSIEEID